MIEYAYILMIAGLALLIAGMFDSIKHKGITGYSVIVMITGILVGLPGVIMYIRGGA